MFSSLAENFWIIGNFVLHGRERGVFALNDGLRHVGLPVQNLLQEFLCELILMVDLVDNQQAVPAVERGV